MRKRNNEEITEKDKNTIEQLKEITKSLKELNKLMGNNENPNEWINKKIEASIKEPVEISIKKDKTGKADIKISGESTAVLVTLAGLEKGILRHTNTPEIVWETIKEKIESSDTSVEDE